MFAMYFQIFHLQIVSMCMYVCKYTYKNTQGENKCGKMLTGECRCKKYSTNCTTLSTFRNITIF